MLSFTMENKLHGAQYEEVNGYYDLDISKMNLLGLALRLAWLDFYSILQWFHQQMFPEHFLPYNLSRKKHDKQTLLPVQLTLWHTVVAYPAMTMKKSSLFQVSPK